MKTEEEIIKLHDLLDAIIHNEIPHNFGLISIERIKENKLALCWVLKHTWGEELQTMIDEYKREFGIEQKKVN